MLKLLLLIGLLGAVICHPHGPHTRTTKAGTCGYPSCPVAQPGKLNVHLVPHTHDDVGWLKTVDQYYYGSRTNIQNAGVQYILDSVVQELVKDPNRKFIYVETAFFWKWYTEQSEEVQQQVKDLVANGQLEFIGGGWSMNDEAVTHYQCIIDQMTWGFRKLSDTFSTCGHPKIGWQIDPFGHSRENAALMAEFGFDGLFFARLDYQDKDNRLKNKAMELIWEANPALGAAADLFSLGTYNNYAAPPGFCFDILCRDDPIIDNPESTEFNVGRRVDDFLAYVREQASHYRTNNILITMGEDFQFQHAGYHFKNLDKLIRYVNERQNSGSEVNVFYSTPSCYVKSLHEANLTWPTKQDDFFPYASDPHAYWTGYFTSRPTLKYFERKSNNFLQISKQLAVITQTPQEELSSLDALREVMGVMQHHDAVVGTEKQHVADDYSRQLTDANRKCGMLASIALGKLFSTDSSTPTLALRSCPMTNISVCSISAEANNFIVNVYNPLSRTDNHYVRLPVGGSTYVVRDPNGNEVKNQVVPIPESLTKVPGRVSSTTQELVFKAADLPPMGYRSYFVSKSDEPKATTRKVTLKDNEELTFSNKHVKLTLNGATGPLTLSDKADVVQINQTLLYYVGMIGDNGASERRSSGAYIFRPDGTEAKEIGSSPTLTSYEGEIVNEVHIVISDWVSEVVKLYSDASYAEIEWLVGPIPIDDNNGKEVITRYTTNINNNGIFHTDSNGRQSIERKRDFRPTWDLDLQEPVAGNYYPVTTDISIDDGSSEVVVIVDRAQGGSSLNDGDLELMVHRRLLHDDAFGVGEALNETAFGQGLVARGTHWVTFGELSNSEWPLRKRLLQQEKVLDSYITLVDADSLQLDFDSWSKNYKNEFSGLTAALPDAVQILTLEPWQSDTVLLRLEHIFDESEGGESVTVNIDGLFSTVNIDNCRETALGGDKWLNETTRLEWQKETNEVPQVKLHKSVKDLPEVELSPKQIRTFICSVQPKKLF